MSRNWVIKNRPDSWLGLLIKIGTANFIFLNPVDRSGMRRRGSRRSTLKSCYKMHFTSPKMCTILSTWCKIIIFLPAMTILS